VLFLASLLVLIGALAAPVVNASKDDSKHLAPKANSSAIKEACIVRIFSFKIGRLR